ncbi:MAG: hypothetical protein ABSD98_13765 [Candidatus Korobacteraceae bacterium]
MATAVMVLNTLVTDTWNAQLDESLSLAARLSVAVKSRAYHFRLSFLLWKINGRISRFFQDVDDLLSGKRMPAANLEPATPEGIQKSVSSLIELGTSFNRIYEEARRKRLLNNSLIAGPIAALRTHAEQFFELAEWLDLIRCGEDVERIFARAAEERRRGDVYDLSQV